MIGLGTVAELVLTDGRPTARIKCASGLIPAPGQYLLAHQPGSDSPVAAALFLGAPAMDGFIAARPAPAEWTPGVRLNLRGPLGHGFVVPAMAGRLALIAFDDHPRRLLALLHSALKPDTSIALVCDNPPDDLPLQIEVQPLSVLQDVLEWSEFAAFDVARESLSDLGRRLRMGPRRRDPTQAQALVRAPMPCGALAECGVCAVRMRRGIGLACEDGPVFDFGSLDLEG